MMTIHGARVIAEIVWVPLQEWLLKIATDQQKEDARVATSEGLVFFGVRTREMEGRTMVAWSV